ncbi:unnamed protein product [Symbiodinium natans]|uniref:Sugar phosphate transporter domain-containing protein n=1 Tax=Symbiodinium natans TaxID=878477 RepID=A0A812V2J7_9DINO|nr:unnamed protein product [Symbiodinium natans]
MAADGGAVDRGHEDGGDDLEPQKLGKETSAADVFTKACSEEEGSSSHGSPLVPLTVLAWILTSISTLMVNKRLFSGSRFPFPLLLLLIHQGCFAVLLTGCRPGCRRLIWPGSRCLAPSAVLKVVMPGFASVSLRAWLRQYLLLGLLQALSMGLQNKALSLVSAHAVIMLSASKPVLVALLQAALKLASFTGTQLKALVCVTLGVSASVTGEVSMSLHGFVFLFGAQVTEAMRIVLMQHLLEDSASKLDVLTLLSLSSPACVLLLTPWAYFLELRGQDLSTMPSLLSSGILVSTVLAFGVNVLSAQVVKVTGALSLVLLGVVKDFMGVFLSAWLFAVPLSIMQVLGYSVAVMFINVYKDLAKRGADAGKISLGEAVSLLLPTKLRCMDVRLAIGTVLLLGAGCIGFFSSRQLMVNMTDLPLRLVDNSTRDGPSHSGGSLRACGEACSEQQTRLPGKS